MKYLPLVLVVLITSTSCVSKRKFDELLAENVKQEAEIQELNDKLDAATQQIERLNKDFESLATDKALTEASLEEKTEELKELQKEHGDLQTIYDNLLKNSGKLNRDLSEQQARLLEMQSNLEEAQRKNDELSGNLAEREKKVQELENILAEKEAAVQKLKDRINNALLSFSDKDLSVEIKNGKVYVSLAEQLLFKSGSIVVDPKGVNALQQLATAIKDQKDLHIMVEGHTDDVPISRTSQYMQDNWDLSVMRATAIVKILTNAGVDPQQITAAGRGEFVPVAANETSEGRQKNRRTEIIITPDLDELFEILGSN